MIKNREGTHSVSDHPNFEFASVIYKNWKFVIKARNLHL
jgi:hypothetical protein